MRFQSDDFEGGDTVLHELDYAIKPVAGRCFAFLSDLLHSGKIVHRGSKIVLVGWLLRKDPRVTI